MFQVTHTLPESSYKDWIRFGCVIRFLGMNSPTITQDVALDSLTWCVQRLAQDDIQRIERLTPDLEAHLIKSLTEPVEPEVLVLAAFYRGLSLAQTPPKQDEFMKTMLTVAKMIAVSYAKELPAVMHDLVDAFEVIDADFNSFRLARYNPSKETFH